MPKVIGGRLGESPTVIKTNFHSVFPFGERGGGEYQSLHLENILFTF